MKLEVIGTYSAFAKQGMTASYVLWRDDESGVLLDCGYPIYQHLRDLGYAEKIKTVLLSHLHQDHCGSAIVLLEYRAQIAKEKTAIGGVDWHKLLHLCEGDDYAKKLVEFPADLALDTWLVPHGKGMECRAMLVDNAVLYSGDTAVSQLDTPQAKQAKLIIHHAHLHGAPLHVAIAELAKAAPEIKAKTWLSHYMPDDYEAFAAAAAQAGLAGVLKPGMVFEL